MLEFLRDAVWQFVGAFIGILAIIVTFLIAKQQRNIKALIYEVITHTPLFSVNKTIKDELQVSYKGQPVQNLRLLEMKFINSGNVDILTTDFERPLSLTFATGTQIFSADIAKTDPPNMQAYLQTEDTKVIVNPVLINRKESFTLRMLVSQAIGEPVVDARIVGIKNIGTYNKIQPFFPLTY